MARWGNSARLAASRPMWGRNQGVARSGGGEGEGGAQGAGARMLARRRTTAPHCAPLHRTAAASLGSEMMRPVEEEKSMGAWCAASRVWGEVRSWEEACEEGAAV